MQKTWVQSLGQQDPLEKEMATSTPATSTPATSTPATSTPFSVLARKIPWTKEPGGVTKELATT